MNTIDILIGVAVIGMGLPFLIYACVKFGTVAFFAARRSFEQFEKDQRNGKS